MFVCFWVESIQSSLVFCRVGAAAVASELYRQLERLDFFLQKKCVNVSPERRFTAIFKPI